MLSLCYLNDRRIKPIIPSNRSIGKIYRPIATFVYYGGNEKSRSEHELITNVNNIWVIRKIENEVPVHRVMLEGDHGREGVDVGQQFVAKFDDLAETFLRLCGPVPQLGICFLAMYSKNWKENAKLHPSRVKLLEPYVFILSSFFRAPKKSTS